MEVARRKEQNNCNYKFVVDHNKKTLRCIAWGFFSTEEAIAYIQEFLKIVSTILDIENYTLIVDARKQEEVAQEVLPLLKKVTNLYMSIPFKDRRYIKLDDFNALTQVIGMGGEKFINSFDMIPEESGNVNGYFDIEEEIYLFDKKINRISQQYYYYKKQETLLIKKIKDKEIRYRLEEYINNTNEVYSRCLYKEAFSKGLKLQKSEQVFH
ncbi:hypothetical protein [Vallitalea guaymasensis]|uniref:hypothetical protein n=1 Tax=Vallitalea guaymasensis TaxID=1185412 RepID=UPI000DE1E540|nr:hypothetical protein [Vallitalea guaymasensis]